MLPNLFNAVLGEHHDPVRVFDGRKSMGDDNGGSVSADLFDRLLNQSLRRRIHRGGSLVKNQDFPVAKNRSRDGKPLLLPAG